MPAACRDRRGRSIAGQDGTAGLPVPGARRARPGQRVREAVEEVRLRIRVGDRELSAGQLLERLGFTARTAVDPGRRPVRRRAAPGADAQAAHGRAQRAAARRADQRPGHRDAHRVRGPAGRLAGDPGGGQPRPVLPGAGDRARRGAARRRQAVLPRRRRGRVPGRVHAPAARPGARAATAPGDESRPAPASASSAAGDRNGPQGTPAARAPAGAASARESELAEQLAANATDYEKLTVLGAELRAVQAEKSELEDRWLDVAAALDT